MTETNGVQLTDGGFDILARMKKGWILVKDPREPNAWKLVPNLRAKGDDNPDFRLSNPADVEELARASFVILWPAGDGTVWMLTEAGRLSPVKNGS